MKITKYRLNANTYVISNELNEAIIIDPSLGMSYVIDEINQKYDVKAVLLTHAHFDHIDGLSFFMDKPIYIHENEIDVLTDPWKNLYYMFYNEPTPFNVNELKLIPTKDDDILDLIGLSIEITHTPGHTQGSVCYKAGNNLFTGDTIFAQAIGRWDFPTGDYEVLSNSVKKLFNKYKDNLKCYAGHENDSCLNDIKKYNSYVREILG